LNIWVFVILSPILVLNPKITKDFPMKMCIYIDVLFPLLTLLFLHVFWIVVRFFFWFVVSCLFYYSKYSLWCFSHYISTSIGKNPIHSNPCICDLCQLTIFVTMGATYFLWHLVKLTCSCINDYKVVCSCICKLYLWLMLIWMKMTMKNTFISSIFYGILK
jgi:hypothetical protein